MNQQEHDKALSRAWELMDAEEGTPEAEELERLAEEIENFEEKMAIMGFAQYNKWVAAIGESREKRAKALSGLEISVKRAAKSIERATDNFINGANAFVEAFKKVRRLDE